MRNQWRILNKRLKEDKSEIYYRSLIEEACELIESYITENKIEKTEKINTQIIDCYQGSSLNTDFNAAKESFISVGTILYELGAINREDIVVDFNLLGAKSSDILNAFCELYDLSYEEAYSGIFRGYHSSHNTMINTVLTKTNIFSMATTAISILSIILLLFTVSIYKDDIAEYDKIIETVFSNKTLSETSTEALAKYDSYLFGITEESQTTQKIFDDKIIYTLEGFNVDGTNLTVRVNVINNYEKEISLWPDGIYVINGSGSTFSLDTSKHLSKNQNTFNLASGENKTFEFYFNDYIESHSLEIKIDKTWCMDSSKPRSEKVNLKLI